MHRRQFIAALAASGSLAVLGSLPLARSAGAAQDLYGELGRPDDNGLQLPAGFTSRVLATTGEPVGDTGFIWHKNPDGGATFATADGWVYVSNDESNDGEGGVSMLRFDRNGSIVSAGPILDGTSRNCAGGPMPWGTWLSCEEFSGGRVWECDPLGLTAAQVRPAMGTFSHEAAAADPDRGVIYLTEDRPNSGLYRFRPDSWGNLAAGSLTVLARSDQGLEWLPVPDPSASDRPTREQVDTMVRFDGGEGAWFDGNHLYFTTKGDNRVWRFDPETDELAVIYDIESAANPVLRGVDNIVVSGAGEIFVCEDGDNMEIVLLDGAGAVAPFLRLDQNGSELTGVAFDPSGTRMYFSSQRRPGRTYEVTGPFRTQVDTVTDTGETSTARVARQRSTGRSGRSR